MGSNNMTNTSTSISDNPSPIKSILESKTFWVNILAIIALFTQSKFGFILDENVQLQILAILNIILRSVTKDPVSWSKN